MTSNPLIVLAAVIVAMCVLMLLAAIFDDAGDPREELIKSMWRYIGRYGEQQLTTEQRILLYDILDRTREKGTPPLVRWWEREKS